MDGAHAGVAAILPEQRHHFRGVELADSFNTNPHKWLLTTFDCSCIWFRDADPLKAALSLTPAYLRGKGNAYDFQVTRSPLPSTRSCETHVQTSKAALNGSAQLIKLSRSPFRTKSFI